MTITAIGYKTVEEWADANRSLLESVAAVYLVRADTVTTAELFVYRRATLMLQVVDLAVSVVHFVYLDFGDQQMLRNAPEGNDWGKAHNEKIDRRRNQVYDLLLVWLQSDQAPPFKAPIFSGQVALPSDLVLLSGWADFIGWDEAEQQFYMIGGDQ